MANNRTITSVGVQFYLSVATIYPQMTLIQGFTADDVTDTDSVTTAVTTKGVDGRLSVGFVPFEINQNITLQADSLSNDFFENIIEYEKAAQEKYIMTGLIIVPATGRQYSLTRGVLKNIPVTPAIRATVQPRRYTITWESVTPSFK